MEQAKEFHEKFLAHTDQARASLVDKHRKELLDMCEQQLQAERQWEEEKSRLLNTIESLKTKLHSQETEISNQKAAKESLQTEIALMQQRLSYLEEAEQNQLTEINRLKKVEREKETNVQELMAANQKIKELEFRIRNVEVSHLNDMAETEENVKRFKDELLSLSERKTAAEEMLKSLELNYEKLKQSNDNLMLELNKTKNENLRLAAEIHRMKIACTETRRPKSASDRNGQTFHDFVQMQREIVSLRDQNEDLLKKLKLGQMKISPGQTGGSMQASTATKRTGNFGQGKGSFNVA